MMENEIKMVETKADKPTMNLSDLNLKLREYKEILLALQNEKNRRDEVRRRLSKITQQRKRNRKTEENKCCTCKSSSVAEKTTESTTPICSGCVHTLCKNEKCSNRLDTTTGSTECKKCEDDRVVHQRAGQWLLEQLNQRLHSPDTKYNNNDETSSETNQPSISRSQRDKVREFVEDLLSSMLNGPLDDVCVGQLYKNDKYIPLWNHECPGVAHIELKRLVQKIIDEILSLPDWLNLGNNHSPGRQTEEALPYFDPKKYEELLATAVINKAINLFKNDKNVAERSSSGIHTDSELDSNHNNSRKELLSLQLAKGTENYFLSGESSPTSQPMSSEFSLDRHEANALYSSLNSQDYLNDYIQNHKVPLPEISSESNNEDDLQSLTSIGTDGTWEENWLFKKRKLKTDATVSIAMLVPSPTEEIKALIGDQNVDEVSDLSETESQTENGDEELLVSINGHYSLPDFNRTDLEPDSLISNHSLPAYEPLVSEAKNTFIFINDQNLIGKTMESSETSSLTTASDVEKFIEENNNIIETFEAPADLIAIAPTTTIEAETLETGTNENTDQENNLVEIRNVKNSIVTTAELILAPPEDFQPTPTARTSILVEPKVTEMASSSAENKLDNGNDATNNESNLGISVVSDEEDQIFSDSFVDGKQPAAEEDEVVHLIPGSIAEREHLKWQNAEPMANNPYSTEALQRRLICGKTKPLDIHLLMDDKDQELGTEDNDAKTLQSVFSEDLTDYKRYGRDYYINDAKNASGSRKAFLESRTLTESETDSDAAKVVEVEKPIPAQRNLDESPITVTILPKSKFTTTPDDTNNNQSISPRPGSLTYSEDSDTTRIYDLSTGETKIVHDTNGNRINSLDLMTANTPTPPSTPLKARQSISTSTLSIQDSNEEQLQHRLGDDQLRKAVSFDTLKLTSPQHRPTKFTGNQKKFEEHHENIVRAFRRHSIEQQVAHYDHHDKLNVIEKEVIEALPRVKDLAKIYIHNDEQKVPLPIVKPKTFIVKDYQEDTHNDTNNKRPNDVGKINLKAVAKTYDTQPHKFKAGHSITARSISRTVREELKNTPIESTIHEKHEPRHTSPERPPSPILLPGNLKNSIAFFENLK